MNFSLLQRNIFKQEKHMRNFKASMFKTDKSRLKKKYVWDDRTHRLEFRSAGLLKEDACKQDSVGFHSIFVRCTPGSSDVTNPVRFSMFSM